MSKTLEQEFQSDMLTIYERAKTELKYNASRFKQMISEHGGFKTAHMLINSNTYSESWAKSWELGRLDLTVEYLVLNNKKYHVEFSTKEIEMCSERLKSLGPKIT